MTLIILSSRVSSAMSYQFHRRRLLLLLLLILMTMTAASTGDTPSQLPSTALVTRIRTSF